MEIIDQRLSTLANTTSTEQSSQMPTPLPNQDASSRTEQKNSAFDLGHIEEWILLRIMTSFQSMFIEHCRYHFFSSGLELNIAVTYNCLMMQVESN
jgi:hypothetical protein